jgi:branched-chain amino acid transport system ATP-binding protein
MADLELKDLTIQFGGLVALQDLSFHVAEEEIITLIGPNGAGKTTAFNIITGFLSPTHGQVMYSGEDIVRLAPHRIASKGLIRTFQKTNIFSSVSVFEGVMMGRHCRTKGGFLKIILNTHTVQKEEERSKEKVEAILDFVGLAHRRDEMARNLSSGEQRLLEIAVALAGEPDLLLLDEPATGMNPSEKERVVALIKKIRSNGVTVLLVEHDMGLVMGISDRIVVLNYGRKIAEGKPREIQENEEVIRAYLGGMD